MREKENTFKIMIKMLENVTRGLYSVCNSIDRIINTLNFR